MAHGSSFHIRRTRRIAAVLACAAAPVVFGCAPMAVRPPAVPRPAPGYEKRVDTLASADTAALRGRRIVLDPGHGGLFRGAIGVGGLTEAEVNLGVALDLRGLLEAAGARVLMTRTSDRDFLTPADSSLRGDLAARVAIANAFDPDLFLSIHHNADVGGAHDVNEIQTYYKLGDQGPSLDAAQDVHRYLVRNLGIERNRVVPGNYFVLRNSVAPALLTESSYITNPDVEAKLALASKQRLEAEALYLGIARFFARRAPRVASLRVVAAPGGPPDSVFADAGPAVEARIEGPFDGVDLRLDGRRIDPVRTDDRLLWRPGAPLAPGPHQVTLAARLGGGGASRAAVARFEIRRPPAAIEAAGLAPAAGDGRFAVRVRIRDRFGMPVPDSFAVRLRSGRGLSPSDTVLAARDGEAWGFLRAAAGAPSAPAVRVALEPSGAPPCSTCAAAVTWSRVAADAWAGDVRAMPDDTPVSGAGDGGPPEDAPWIGRDGFALLARDSTGAPRLPALPGWRLWGAAGADTPRVVAIAGGALAGHRIVIDPDGGGDQSGGTGHDGTRAAHLNLEVGRMLAAYLESAGARVLLTRDGDLALSDVERVEKSERFGAERFLRIAHRPEPPRIGYYFSSAAGRAWADRAVAALADFGFPTPRPAEDAQYPLQQTSCPALYVSAARIDVPAEERRLLAPGTARAEAYALFLALAREWAPRAAWPLDSVEVRDAAGRPSAGAFVTLGGAFVLETGPDGTARFARTEPGPLEATLALQDGHGRRALLLESQQGVILTGPGEP